MVFSYDKWRHTKYVIRGGFDAMDLDSRSTRTQVLIVGVASMAGGAFMLYKILPHFLSN